MIENEHPESEVVRQRIDELEQNWDNLKDLSDKYQTQLDVSAQAKQVCLCLCVLELEHKILPQPQGKLTERVRYYRPTAIGIYCCGDRATLKKSKLDKNYNIGFLQ